MDNVALYLLLVIALGIGFLLGRRERRKRPRNEAGLVSKDYFRGLNHLLNERPDLAIDTFVEAMVVDDDTVDTHLALGSLVRRRGEVDKAIRIHQNLLARPVLSKANRAQAELELAQDYLVAGLLGRAENLLQELAGRNAEHKQLALQLLLEVYERESEWLQALRVGKQLAKQDRGVRCRMAHFHCELAEKVLAEGNLREARSRLASALQLDGKCARANLIGARVEYEAKRYREVVRLLRRVRDQDPALVVETLDLYRRACDELGDSEGLLTFARETLEVLPAVELVETLGHHIEHIDDPAAAQAFVVAQLLRHPSLGGFVMLLKLLDEEGEPLQTEYVRKVRKMSEALLEKQPTYRCSNCGFAGRTLMWQCPSCHDWGSICPLIRDDVEPLGVSAHNS